MASAAESVEGCRQMDASTPPDSTWTPVGEWILDGAASVTEMRRWVAAVAREHEVDQPDRGRPLLDCSYTICKMRSRDPASPSRTMAACVESIFAPRP